MKQFQIGEYVDNRNVRKGEQVVNNLDEFNRYFESGILYIEYSHMNYPGSNDIYIFTTIERSEIDSFGVEHVQTGKLFFIVPSLSAYRIENKAHTTLSRNKEQ